MATKVDVATMHKILTSSLNAFADRYAKGGFNFCSTPEDKHSMDVWFDYFKAFIGK